MAENKNGNSNLVLYRKYRPRDFSKVLGQDHIVSVLQNAVKTDRVAHAYLFSGPHGTGKTTIARILAKAVSCADANAAKRPCEKCDICRDINEGRAFDLVEMDAASSRGIDEIRSLRDAVGLAPFKAKRKTYIIDEVHMLTKEAFNALLKTLEEPPEHAVFILATTELAKVPETIGSRCQKFEFKKVPDAVVQKSLMDIAEKEGVNIARDAAGLIALFADGSFRDAQSMLGQAISVSEKDVSGDDVRALFGAPARDLVERVIKSVISKDAPAAIDAVAKSAEQGIDPYLLLKFLIRDMRNIFILNINPRYEKTIAESLDARELEFLKSETNRAESKDIERALSVFLDCYSRPRLSYLPRLPLEIAVAKAAMRG